MITSSRESGFTLVELLIVMVIIAAVASLAGAGFSQLRLSSRLTGYSQEMVSTVHGARSEAIKRNASVRVCVSADGATCVTTGGWQQGWIMLDSDDNLIDRSVALQTGFEFKAVDLGGGSEVREIRFDRTGLAVPAALFTLCRKTPSAGHQEREVLISPTGQTTISVTYNGLCT